MKEKILDIVKKVYHNHLTPETATNILLDFFNVKNAFWKNEYDKAIKEISNLQNQIKDAEAAMNDMENELRNRD